MEAIIPLGRQLLFSDFFLAISSSGANAGAIADVAASF